MPEHLKFVKVKEAHETFIKDCTTIRSGSLIFEAIEALLTTPTAQTVFVINDVGNLLGMIPLRDLIRVASARYGIHGRGFSEFLQYLKDIMKDDVDDIMRPPMNVNQNDNLMKAMKIMEYYDLNSLPVVDDDGKLLGELNGVELLKFAVEGVKKSDLKAQRLKEEKEAKKRKKEEEKRKKEEEK
jgi:CBS domain-containing protein